MHDRIRTGIKGLDNLIDGGFVKGSVNLVSGAPGTGKTIFGCQFMNEGLKNGEIAILITLEEGMGKVKKIMNLHNMNPSKYIDEGKLYIIDLGEPNPEGGKQAATTFTDIADFVKNLLQFSAPSRIVIDSLSPLMQSSASIEQYRKGKDSLTRSGVEEFICDTFLFMDIVREGAILKRTFEIRKMRYSQFNTSMHTAIITQAGLDVF
jgi:KaiC/GvpD/RAD55 family RecA-like ATPase